MRVSECMEDIIHITMDGVLVTMNCSRWSGWRSASRMGDCISASRDYDLSFEL
ncbi:unnamed protein product [Cuscuta epithymum]|uniref:Uncharacterized protein n=1 Tax=Cuscuta epithymum TaxID=186058 RepID=A0AAV0ENC8_9ASTE|nr:unnamed protein product [Cuscuta epithymum]CAH9124099.1 unnamed protein product [Cuscuta epithymum]